MPASSPSAPAQAGPGPAFNLAAIVLIAAAGGLALAYGIDHLARADPPPPLSAFSGPLIEKTMSGVDLAIPEDWFRDPAERADGFTERVDLELFAAFPGLAAPTRVAVTLQPRSRARTSAWLLDAVYLHLFEGAQLDGPPGLVGKPLRPEPGYEAETVWYDPLVADPFVAKCTAAMGGGPAQCLRTVMLGERIAVTYVFPEELLPAWREFDAVMMELLGPAGLG